jgi:hypothetical protein
MSKLNNSPERPISAPPSAASTSNLARSPPTISHFPVKPSPLSAATLPIGRSVSASIPSSGLAGLSDSVKGKGKGKGRVLGIQDRLRNEVDGVVKRRNGGVLGRG